MKTIIAKLLFNPKVNKSECHKPNNKTSKVYKGIYTSKLP
jgi:hypothetical protein